MNKSFARKGCQQMSMFPQSKEFFVMGSVDPMEES